MAISRLYGLNARKHGARVKTSAAGTNKIQRQTTKPGPCIITDASGDVVGYKAGGKARKARTPRRRGMSLKEDTKL